MKLKQSIIKQIQMQPEEFREKVLIYLKKNQYRITDQGSDYIIFTEDEFSDRKNSRSDAYKRIGEGKFEFYAAADQQITVKLIYLTPVAFPFLIMMVFSGFGIYTGTITPIVISFLVFIPVIFRVLAIKGNVFYEILKC